MSQIESLFPGAVKKFVKAAQKYPRDYKFTAKVLNVMDMEGQPIEVEVLVAASKVNPNEQFMYSNEDGRWEKTDPRIHARGKVITHEGKTMKKITVRELREIIKTVINEGPYDSDGGMVGMFVHDPDSHGQGQYLDCMRCHAEVPGGPYKEGEIVVCPSCKQEHVFMDDKYGGMLVDQITYQRSRSTELQDEMLDKGVCPYCHENALVGIESAEEGQTVYCDNCENASVWTHDGAEKKEQLDQDWHNDNFAESKTIKMTLKQLRESISEVILEAAGLTDEEEDQVTEMRGEAEYASIDAFAEYLAGEDRDSYTHLDMHALWRNLNDLGQPTTLQQIKAALGDWGFKFAPRAIPKQVRGINSPNHDRWYGKGSDKTHGGAGIDASTGRGTVQGKTI